MRILPNERHLGWTPLAWLIYSIPFLINTYESRTELPLFVANVLAYAAFKLLSSAGIGREMTILENNAMQSIATSAGYMTAPLVSSIPAYMLVTGQVVPPLHALPHIPQFATSFADSLSQPLSRLPSQSWKPFAQLR